MRAAIEEEGRLGKAGRVFDGAELNPEKRGIRKLLNIILELIHLIEGPNASHRLDILLATCLWDKAKRIGKEFLENLKCAVLWFFAEARAPRHGEENVGRDSDRRLGSNHKELEEGS